MSSWSFMYNNVSDSITDSGDTIEIPEYMLEAPKLNKELTLYHVYDTTNNCMVWLQWHATKHEWYPARTIPEAVKLAKMVM